MDVAWIPLMINDDLGVGYIEKHVGLHPGKCRQILLGKVQVAIQVDMDDGACCLE